MDGKIFIVGIGPGGKDNITFKAMEVLKNSDVIVGYKTYTDLVKDFIFDKQIVSSGMKKEVERCNEVFELAKNGKTVSLISSGDAGVYGMAGIMLEVLQKENSNIELEVVAGVTSSLYSASLLGAPLMNDFATISLSDLMIDFDVIKKRLELAAMGDFVISLYNPKSKERQNQIVEAQNILLKYRKSTTPVGIVKNGGRADCVVIITTLGDMLNHDIDMTTTIIIGNSQTYIWNNKIITPRGYIL